MGTRQIWVVAATLMLLVTACSDSTPPPTLATGTTATSSTSTTVTTTLPPTTTTTAAPTTTTSTTQSPDARFAEIERMVHEALVGRLQAMFDKDPEALLPWVGSQKVYDDTIDAMELVVFVAAPTSDSVGASLEELLLDRADCVVTRIGTDLRGVLEEADAVGESVFVWWPNDAGVLQVAAVWGEGTPQQIWMEECDLSPRGVTP